MRAPGIPSAHAASIGFSEKPRGHRVRLVMEMSSFGALSDRFGATVCKSESRLDEEICAGIGTERDRLLVRDAERNWRARQF